MALVTARSGPLNAGRFVRTVQLFEISKRFAASTTTLLEALGQRSTTLEPERSATSGGTAGAAQPVSTVIMNKTKRRAVAQKTRPTSGNRLLSVPNARMGGLCLTIRILDGIKISKAVTS